jgi:hypothetical protein
MIDRRLSFLLLAPLLLRCGDDEPDPDPNPMTGDECPAQTGPGTDQPYLLEGTVTWTAADSPHRVMNGLSVRGTLTIEPCARVLVRSAIDVSGTLITRGAGRKRVTIGALDQENGWNGIRVVDSDGGMLDLAYTDISGTRSTGSAALDVRGQDVGPPQPRIKVDHLKIDAPQAYGVQLLSNALFTSDSRDLEITGGQTFPIFSDPALAGSIPVGSYTGNAIDEIVLDGDIRIASDTTWRDLGVPYRIGGGGGAGPEIVVGVSGPEVIRAKLTIEAGVRLKVATSGRFRMAKSASSDQAVGVLVVQGTAAKRVIFTSASPTPAAGNWRGLVFDAQDPEDRIDYARVEYAGGPSGANSFHCEVDGAFGEDEDAAIALFGQPGSPFITNTEIADSAGDGIGRSWSGPIVDFAATNTFSNIAECRQTQPRDQNGACPAQATCD